MIIVAHRLTIVRHCSGLLFVGSGQVVDSGTFDELLDRNAEFRRMMQMAPASQGSPDA
jgi:ATP-binding cassette, subfamily B, bacterial PglK